FAPMTPRHCSRCLHALSRTESRPVAGFGPQKTKKPALPAFHLRREEAYLMLMTQAASFLASSSLTALGGIGTGPHTPELPFLILPASIATASPLPAYLAATSL